MTTSKKVISLRIDEQLASQVKELINKKGITQNEFIEQAILNYASYTEKKLLEEEKQKNEKITLASRVTSSEDFVTPIKNIEEQLLAYGKVDNFIRVKVKFGESIYFYADFKITELYKNDDPGNLSIGKAKLEDILPDIRYAVFSQMFQKYKNEEIEFSIDNLLGVSDTTHKELTKQLNNF
ncbi:ribbon-helix-helix protein, CopG family [Neisseriaceae bacterium PsAf]|nr:ribbon-helix-helix protein, CopG family [Neisseriaceae bacterium PsAf]